MKKRLFQLLGAGVLCLLVVGAAAPPETRFTSQYCPECRIYLWAAGATDMKGNCAACGKYPVELEVQRATWYWCSLEKNWLRSPCAEHAARLCCAREESLAAVVPAGPELSREAYCPGDRTFAMGRLPLLGLKVCGICYRPAVNVPAARRTWFWCESEGMWATSACPMNEIRNCCAKQEVLLLAKPEFGPIARR